MGGRWRCSRGSFLAGSFSKKISGGRHMLQLPRQDIPDHRHCAPGCCIPRAAQLARIKPIIRSDDPFAAYPCEKLCFGPRPLFCTKIFFFSCSRALAQAHIAPGRSPLRQVALAISARARTGCGDPCGAGDPATRHGDAARASACARRWCFRHRHRRGPSTSPLRGLHEDSLA